MERGNAQQFESDVWSTTKLLSAIITIELGPKTETALALRYGRQLSDRLGTSIANCQSNSRLGLNE